VNIFTALLLSVLVSFQTFSLIQRFNSPFTLYSNILRSNFVKKDEELAITYSFYKTRLCLVDLDQFMTDVDSGEIVWRSRVPGSPQKPGPVTVKGEIKLPDIVEEEHTYDLNVNIISRCSEGIHVDTWPTLRFKVIK
jgi:hypothetical protein